MKHKIMVATTNPGKIAELRELLNTDAVLLSLKDFDGIAEVPETGDTFADNARIKALGICSGDGAV